MRPGLLISILILSQSHASLAAAKPRYAQTVDQIYRQAMDNYFLNIVNVANANPQARQFVEEAFRPLPTDAETKKSLAGLKNLKTPKVYSIDKGLEFEFDNQARFQMVLSSKYGEVQITEKQKTARATPFFEYFNPLNKADAALGLILQGAGLLLRMIVGNSVRAAAVGVGGGAAGGCVIGAQLKYEYQSVGEACLGGATVGAMVGPTVVFGLSNEHVKGILGGSSAAGAKVLPFLRVVGALGSVALVGQSLQTMATMNGALLRCQGAQGDFIVHAKTQGATQQALYGVLGDAITFYFKEGEKRITLSPPELKKFFKTRDHFKELSEDQLESLANFSVLKEVHGYRELCRKRGDGHTQSYVYSSSARVVNDDKPTPAAK